MRCCSISRTRRSGDIRGALKDTLCRCAGYPAIEGAIMAAAEAVRTGQPVRPPQIAESVRPQRVIGRVQVRPDAVEKVNGKAVYADDLVFPGMLYAVSASRRHSARILEATGRRGGRLGAGSCQLCSPQTTFPAAHNHGLVVYDWPVLVGVGERIRYVGDALALVAAETQDAAATRRRADRGRVRSAASHLRSRAGTPPGCAPVA